MNDLSLSLHKSVISMYNKPDAILTGEPSYGGFVCVVKA